LPLSCGDAEGVVEDCCAPTVILARGGGVAFWYKIYMSSSLGVNSYRYACGDYAFSIPAVMAGIRNAIAHVDNVKVSVVEVHVRGDKARATIITLPMQPGLDIRIILPEIGIHNVKDSETLVRGVIQFTNTLIHIINSSGLKRQLIINRIDLCCEGHSILVSFTAKHNIYQRLGLDASKHSIEDEYRGVGYKVTGLYPWIFISLMQGIREVTANPWWTANILYYILSGRPHRDLLAQRYSYQYSYPFSRVRVI